MTVHCQSGLRVSYHLLLANSFVTTMENDTLFRGRMLRVSYHPFLANSAVITMENDKVLPYQITISIDTSSYL